MVSNSEVVTSYTACSEAWEKEEKPTLPKLMILKVHYCVRMLIQLLDPKLFCGLRHFRHAQLAETVIYA